MHRTRRADLLVGLNPGEQAYTSRYSEAFVTDSLAIKVEMENPRPVKGLTGRGAQSI